MYIKPPRLTDSKQQIKKLIKDNLSLDNILINPVSGENQRSIQYIDLNGDKNDEAVVFYKKDMDGLYDLSIGCMILKQNASRWYKYDTINLYGTSFIKILFSDFDNDGNKEIILFYNIEGSTIKNIAVYKDDGAKYNELMTGTYVGFVLDDIYGDSKLELAVFNEFDFSSPLLKCSLYKFQDNKLDKTDEISFKETTYNFNVNIVPEHKSNKKKLLSVNGGSTMIEVVNNKLLIYGK